MNTYVISLGGSLINNSEGKLDEDFIERFSKLIKGLLKNNRFIILCGGGKTARSYQESAKKFNVKKEDMDWIGIMATRINAEFMRGVFGTKQKVIYDPTHDVRFGEDKVLIAAGWKPGWSTDYDAVRIAINIGAKMVINMSNIKYVYDKDPNKFKDAKPIKNITWKKFRKIVGDKWDPGLNAPFDPIASKIADESKVTTFVIGEDLKNFQDVLNGKKFIGTKIE